MAGRGRCCLGEGGDGVWVVGICRGRNCGWRGVGGGDVGGVLLEQMWLMVWV